MTPESQSTGSSAANDGDAKANTGFNPPVTSSNQATSGTSVNSTVTASSSVDSAKVIPSQLKEKFHEHELDENEQIIDTVATKVVETVGEDMKKDSDSDAKKSEFKPLSPFEVFLNETNLTKKQFIMFVLFFVVLLMSIIASFYFLFSLFGGEPKEVTDTDEVVVVEETVEPDKPGLIQRIFGPKKEDPAEQSEESSVENDDSKQPADEKPKDESDVKESVETPPSQLGKTVKPTFKSNSLRVARKIGFGETVEDRLSFYVRTYRKVRNIFNTDLFDYLAAIPDRKAGYDQFLTQFKGSFEEFKLAHEDLRQEIAQYQNRLNALTEQASQIENKFFGELDNLESENIPETLRAFQDLTQKKNLVLSELKAHEAIELKYANAVPVIESKIRAIEVNEDPFVKGVKVVEFRQVDLELVIEGGE